MPCCFWFWYQALLLWMTTRSPVCVPGSPAFQAHQVIMAAKACLAVTAVMAATVHPELRERKARAGDQDYLGHVGSPDRVERQVPRGLSGLQGNVRCPRDQPSVPSDQRAGYLRQPTHPSPSTVCC